MLAVNNQTLLDPLTTHKKDSNFNNYILITGVNDNGDKFFGLDISARMFIKIQKDFNHIIRAKVESDL